LRFIQQDLRSITLTRMMPLNQAADNRDVFFGAKIHRDIAIDDQLSTIRRQPDRCANIRRRHLIDAGRQNIRLDCQPALKIQHIMHRNDQMPGKPELRQPFLSGRGQQ
jgi:hypothetical protein